MLDFAKFDGFLLVLMLALVQFACVAENASPVGIAEEVGLASSIISPASSVSNVNGSMESQAFSVSSTRTILAQSSVRH